MGEWKECNLGDVVSSNKESIGKNYPYHTILYLDTGSITRGKIDSFQEYGLSKAPSRAKRLVKNNDIVYSTVRPIQRHYGFIVNPPKNLVVSTGFSVIETKIGRAEPLFIYYFLTSDEIVETLDVIAEASTSTYPSLKPSDIETLDILLPPLPEQRAIASVLSSLDDKIELLHRQNKTLEAMAETLFRQWFVEEADEGWEEKTLSSIAEHKKYNVKPDQNPATIYRHYSIPAFDDGKQPIKELGSEIKSNKYQVVPNSILISKLNPRFPRVWAITDLMDENSICSTEFQVVYPTQTIYYGFIYCLLKSKQVTEELIGAAGGTSGSHQRVKPEDVFNLSFQMPSDERIGEFNLITSDHLKKVSTNMKQIRILEKLRDPLLPKLMSGEVRIQFGQEATV